MFNFKLYLWDRCQTLKLKHLVLQLICVCYLLLFSWLGTVAAAVQNDFSTEEEAWLSQHQDLRVGYIANYLPYCAKDNDGKVYGLITDVFQQTMVLLKLEDRLSVKYFQYESYDDMLDGLHQGDVDVVFPVGGSAHVVAQDGLDTTVPVVNTWMNLIYKGDYNEEKTRRIAVNSSNKLQCYYVQNYYPEAQLIDCKSINECLEAVYNGSADATILNGLRIDILRNSNRSKDLFAQQLPNNDLRSMGVVAGNNGLLKLLNHGIMLLGMNYGLNASYNYIHEFYSYSWQDLIYNNLPLMIIFFAIMLFLVMLALINYFHSIKDAHLETENQINANQELIQELANKTHRIAQLEQELAAMKQELDGMKDRHH